MPNKPSPISTDSLQELAGVIHDELEKRAGKEMIFALIAFSPDDEDEPDTFMSTTELEVMLPKLVTFVQKFMHDPSEYRDIQNEH